MNIGDSEDKNDVAHTVCVNSEEIKTVDKLELLGVIIGSNLNFADHVSLICKKASQRTGVLMRLRNLIPKCQTNAVQSSDSTLLNFLLRTAN